MNLELSESLNDLSSDSEAIKSNFNAPENSSSIANLQRDEEDRSEPI